MVFNSKIDKASPSVEARRTSGLRPFLVSVPRFPGQNAASNRIAGGGAANLAGRDATAETIAMAFGGSVTNEFAPLTRRRSAPYADQKDTAGRQSSHYRLEAIAIGVVVIASYINMAINGFF